MTDYSPVYVPGTEWSATTNATVTGGQLLEVSGNGTVGVAGASSAKVVGVAAFDAANGARVTVFPLRMVHRVTATGSITAGDQLVAAANGQVSSLAAAAGATATDINNARAVIGVALTTATDGTKVTFQGR